MSSKEECERLLSDVTWERMSCPITPGSNLLVELYIAEKKNGKGSAVEISEEVSNHASTKELLKTKRIKIKKKGKKYMAFFANGLGRLVAMGEISLRMREQKNASKK